MLTTLLDVAGLALAVVAVFVLAGIGWALLALGIALLLVSRSLTR